MGASPGVPHDTVLTCLQFWSYFLSPGRSEGKLEFAMLVTQSYLDMTSGHTGKRNTHSFDQSKCGLVPELVKSSIKLQCLWTQDNCMHRQKSIFCCRICCDSSLPITLGCSCCVLPLYWYAFLIFHIILPAVHVVVFTDLAIVSNFYWSVLWNMCISHTCGLKSHFQKTRLTRYQILEMTETMTAPQGEVSIKGLSLGLLTRLTSSLPGRWTETVCFKKVDCLNSPFCLIIQHSSGYWPVCRQIGLHLLILSWWNTTIVLMSPWLERLVFLIPKLTKLVCSFSYSSVTSLTRHDRVKYVSQQGQEFVCIQTSSMDIAQDPCIWLAEILSSWCAFTMFFDLCFEVELAELKWPYGHLRQWSLSW